MPLQSSNTETLTIFVQDVSIRPPRFLPFPSALFVVENVAIPMVYQLNATDDDLIDVGQLRYSITAPFITRSIFTLDPLTGVLSVLPMTILPNDPFNQIFLIYVTVTDSGGNTASDFLTVYTTANGLNTPVFSEANYFGAVDENKLQALVTFTTPVFAANADQSVL